jgi:acetyl esterase/lipase
MKRKLLLFAIGMLFLRVNLVAQPNVFNPNDTLVTYDSTHPPVLPPTNTIVKWVRTARPEITWNTSSFKSYYYNDMAFRLRFPKGYNPADPTKKYPVIVFFHGGGEVAPVTDNEWHLLWGAQLFAGMIDAGQFDAFLLFPQEKTI